MVVNSVAQRLNLPARPAPGFRNLDCPKFKRWLLGIVPYVSQQAWYDNQKPNVRLEFDRWLREGSSASALDMVEQKRGVDRAGLLKNEKMLAFCEGEYVPQNIRLVMAVREIPMMFPLGPYIYGVQNAIKAKLCEEIMHGSVFLMPFIPCCGLNFAEVGSIAAQILSSHDDITIFTTDKSGFDQSITQEACDFELRLYDLIRPLSDSERACLIAQSATRRMTFGNHRVTVSNMQGYRNSGDYNTSLGNTLLNGSTIEHTFTALGYSGTALVVSDDAVLFVYDLGERNPASFASDFCDYQLAHFGFQNKIQVNHSIFEADFLSCRFLPCATPAGASSLCLSPTLKCLSKINFTFRDPPSRTITSFSRSVWTGMRTLFCADPRVLAIFDALLYKLPPDDRKYKVRVDDDVHYFVRDLPAFDVVPDVDGLASADVARYGIDLTPDFEEMRRTTLRSTHAVHEWVMPNWAMRRDCL
jgi:hypothetical protein